MFCPKCRAEFQEGYLVCEDCHVDLVAERPPEIHHQANFVDYESIGSIHNPAEITLIKSILAEENIAFFFQGEEFSFLYPGVAVQLMVRKDQVEAAQELLQTIDGPDSPAPDEDAEPPG